MKPRVSVIIPVYNDAERLAMCLDALASQTLPVEEFEAFVVDNGSDEPPEAVVATYPFARLLHESRPGSYAARNRALPEARADVVAFTDADCVPSPDWLRHGLRRVEADDRLVIGGAIEVFASDEQRPTAVELYDIAFGLRQQSYVENFHYAATANMITSRAVINSVGPFNDDLKSSGDSEWGARAHTAGWPLVYADDVRVRHPARRDLSAILTKARRHAGGRIDHLRTRADRPSRGRQLWSIVRMLTPQLDNVIKGRPRLRERGFGETAWLRAGGVLLAVQYAKALEMIRTRLGGRSVRR